MIACSFIRCIMTNYGYYYFLCLQSEFTFCSLFSLYCPYYNECSGERIFFEKVKVDIYKSYIVDYPISCFYFCVRVCFAKVLRIPVDLASKF